MLGKILAEMFSVDLNNIKQNFTNSVFAPSPHTADNKTNQFVLADKQSKKILYVKAMDIGIFFEQFDLSLG